MSEFWLRASSQRRKVQGMHARCDRSDCVQSRILRKACPFDHARHRSEVLAQPRASSAHPPGDMHELAQKSIDHRSDCYVAWIEPQRFGSDSQLGRQCAERLLGCLRHRSWRVMRSRAYAASRAWATAVARNKVSGRILAINIAPSTGRPSCRNHRTAGGRSTP